MSDQRPLITTESTFAAASPAVRPSADRIQTNRVPGPVRTAFVLWLVAIGAGVFETVLAIIDLLADGSAAPGEIAVGVVIRLAVFVAAGVIAIRMRQGRNWARLALVLLLGVGGTLSLVIAPIQWLLEGNSLNTALANVTLTGFLFTTSRVIHVGAVLGAVVSMFRPDANAYFRRRRRNR